MDLSDRVTGSVLGLGLGDALGAPFTGRRSGEVPLPLPAFELPWMGRPAGSTTDGTAMARNLVRSLAAGGTFDPGDLVARHLEWLRTEPPGAGSFTRRVLGRVRPGRTATAAAEEIWRERGPEVSAGNGSVTYCAPLGLAFAHRRQELPALAPALSALTHADGRCRTAVLAVTDTVAALTRGQDSHRAVRGALELVSELPGGEELEFLTEAIGSSRRIDGPDQGFCLYAAGVGLQAAARQEGFEAALRRVVGMGGDAGANGAVAGALLGARDGLSGLPARWLSRLEDRAAIRTEAEGLLPLARRGLPGGRSPRLGLP